MRRILRTYALGMLLLCGLSRVAGAQAAPAAPAAPAARDTARPIRFHPVLTQALQDPELAGYSLQSSVAELAPLATDTVDHRHGAEVFGYILEGSIVTQVDGGPRTTYTAGQMFYEPRNALHGHFENPSRTSRARVLILFLIKDGRPGYTRERP
jgi:quercetin dioxygenase-like cupin family protein